MCGLFGEINHHKRRLDKRAFITLGCANDSRGGDACGIMIDRKVEKGTEGADKLFANWYEKSKVLEETEKCYVAFGHCRKASVGGVTADKAQPITLYDNEGNLLFCLIHNGTIYNYKELAKKYIPDIDIEGLSDSQVMARIFYYKGYDVLGEYEGGGAFIIQDYRVNKTLMFRGESLGSYSAVKPEAERPLFMVETGKSVVFSSILNILQGLYWKFPIYDVPSNVLLECDGLTIYKVKEYDRSKCRGYKSYVTNTTHSPATADWRGLYSSTTSMLDFDCHTGTYIDSVKKEDLHGILYISPAGYISKYKYVSNEPYYFWEGIMLSGEYAYTAVRDFHASGAAASAVTNLARRLSCNPVLINRRYYWYDFENDKIPLTESYTFPLTGVEVVCKKSGKVSAINHLKARHSHIPVELSKRYVDKVVDYVKKSI